MDSVSSPSHILIVDDDPRICSYYAELLEQAGYAVGTICEASTLFDCVNPANLSCILLDIRLTADQDGTSLYREMLERGWNVPVIFVSAFGSIPLAVKVVRAGALNVLSKAEVAEDPHILVQAVKEAVVTANQWRKEDTAKQQALALMDTLTPREIETISWVLTGRLNKQIAAELGITERTVIAHRMSVMKKIRIASLVELIRFADLCEISPAEAELQ